jgi:hypothetical protein
MDRQLDSLEVSLFLEISESQYEIEVPVEYVLYIFNTFNSLYKSNAEKALMR